MASSGSWKYLYERLGDSASSNSAERSCWTACPTLPSSQWGKRTAAGTWSPAPVRIGRSCRSSSPVTVARRRPTWMKTADQRRSGEHQAPRQRGLQALHPDDQRRGRARPRALAARATKSKRNFTALSEEVQGLEMSVPVVIRRRCLGRPTRRGRSKLAYVDMLAGYGCFFSHCLTSMNPWKTARSARRLRPGHVRRYALVPRDPASEVPPDRSREPTSSATCSSTSQPLRSRPAPWDDLCPREIDRRRRAPSRQERPRH